MYRQVLVHHDDRDYQRILWRTSAAQPISHYRLRTVTYGTATAPFLATRCLYATGKDADEPQTGFMIKNNFYVDDLIAGANSVEEAINLKADITKTLAIRGFPLSKWVSNDLSIIQNVDMQTSAVDIAEIDTESSLKILGLHWQPLKDFFTFKVAPVVNACTKRVILSDSSKIYDPLGFLSPCTVLLKTMFQQLWLHDIQWDEDIPVALSQSWLTFRQNYACFNSLRIPRWVHTSPRDKFQLCGFSDASQMAYAAAVYCRIPTAEGAKVFLLTAKTKVAPLKQMSLPRLELAGTLLLAKLFKAVKGAMELGDVECIAWTDSMIVLGWLSSHPRRWKT
ncbi:PREDICTED: uncharacterized protein LOC108375071 [Rhagoletis zephyria]|uniref:uncharacterized protein LOC108375071 n=1 Tax=Rhagoletis zephyria TaxID=28612 RepID=UPI0008112F55|nr:PREDICTED: uncharacterized protein LOC108375071 [Rhagoletis zephyria]